MPDCNRQALPMRPADRRAPRRWRAMSISAMRSSDLDMARHPADGSPERAAEP
jgi:hypothetical protein